jgi:TRAP-type C4-dicarboxylate transport system permease small subunit
MNVFFKITEWVTDRLKTLGGMCLVGMTLLTCVDVIGRSLRHPIFGSEELVGFMATMAVVMGLPYTEKLKGHVGVEILIRLLPAKRQALLDSITGLLSLGLFSIITWRMLFYAHTMQLSGEVSICLELPEYVIIYVCSFCFLVLSLVILAGIIDNIKKIRGK